MATVLKDESWSAFVYLECALLLLLRFCFSFCCCFFFFTYEHIWTKLTAVSRAHSIQEGEVIPLWAKNTAINRTRNKTSARAFFPPQRSSKHKSNFLSCISASWCNIMACQEKNSSSVRRVRSQYSPMLSARRLLGRETLLSSLGKLSPLNTQLSDEGIHCVIQVELYIYQYSYHRTVNHNYCIYLHKILIEKTQLTIKNNFFDYEIFYSHN